MKIYISGKITGLDIEVARANFKAAEDYVIAMYGHLPSFKGTVNPMDKVSEGDENRTWLDYMIDDLILMREEGVDTIYLQSNWKEDSIGCEVEKLIAEKMQWLIIYGK